MKQLFLALMVLPVFLFGQQNVVSLSEIEPEFYQFTLDSTDTAIVYYIYPPSKGKASSQRTAIGTTLPTSTAAQAKSLLFNSNGALTLSVVTDSVTAQESDSLLVYVQSLIYDSNKATWYRSTNDSLFLDFDTPGTYTGTTAGYLDWTHGSCYTANLGGEIMPAAGIAVTFIQKAANNAGADTRLSIGFWWHR